MAGQMDKEYETRDVGMVFLTVDPKWNDLSSDSRFQELVKRCHFVLSR
jgi:hypothetical protein